ncbi:MAG: hypothetical protein KDK70_05425 [Myxococcales bacterium]|nr:hypothetical protein [Myxococcales bacterium]
MVEQGCKSMDPKLEDFADEAFGGPGIENGAKHAAVLKIAEYVREHRLDCNNAFGVSTGITTTSPSCNEEGNGVGYASLLESGTWSFDPDGLLVDNVTISVSFADWTGLSPLDEAPEECLSADENDGMLFLEVDPDPGATSVVLAAGSASVEGPWLEGEMISGCGSLESEATACAPARCSSLALLLDPLAGLGSLENLVVRSVGAAVVGTSKFELMVDDVAVRLWDRVLGVHDVRTGTLTFAPGTMRMIVGASSGGSSYAVTATNELEWVLTAQRQGWAATTLMIGYDDADGDHWTLALEPTQWH